MVSQRKRRFIDAEYNFDLDLSYVCDRLLAMALPCVDGAFYRNDIREVARFFSSRHYGTCPAPSPRRTPPQPELCSRMGSQLNLF